MLYPVFLDLRGLSVIVVGGGTVAKSKLAGLLAAGARVTVVAPETDITGVEVIREHFAPHHLNDARYVVAAAPPDVNLAVAAAADARKLFVNAVDDTAAATAYLGGVIRKADVTVAISTQGLAPALAGLLREALEYVLPDDLDKWIEVATRARAEWKAAKLPMTERRPALLRALNRIYA